MTVIIRLTRAILKVQLKCFKTRQKFSKAIELLSLMSFFVLTPPDSECSRDNVNFLKLRCKRVGVGRLKSLDANKIFTDCTSVKMPICNITKCFKG